MERITEDPVETDICNDIGYSGTKVLRLGFNKDKPFFQEGELNYYDFYFELGDISNLDVKAGDHVGFAVAASSDIAVVSAYCYDADGNAIPTDLGGGYLSEPYCWEIKGFTIPEGTDFSNFRFRFFLAFFAEATCDHVYFDSLGIGSECVAYDYKDDQIEVGFSVVPGWQGRGLATAALKKVLDYLTGNEGIHCVTAWCASENIASRRVLEKAGMKLVCTEKKDIEVGERVFDRLVYEYRPAER